MAEREPDRDAAPVYTELRNDAREGATYWDWYCQYPPDGALFDVVRDAEDGWRCGHPVRRILEIRVTADAPPPPAPRYSFTRDQLIDALTRLDVSVRVSGPAAGMINAESMADALIEALEDGGNG
jgi:hypothetical protein